VRAGAKPSTVLNFKSVVGYHPTVGYSMAAAPARLEEPADRLPAQSIILFPT